MKQVRSKNVDKDKAGSVSVQQQHGPPTLLKHFDCLVLREDNQSNSVYQQFTR